MIRTRNIWIIALLIWSLSPLFWQVYTSFCSPESLIQPLSNSGHRWTLDNYRQVLTADPPFWRYLLNSAIVGISSTSLTLLLAIPAAYSLSRIPAKLARLVKLLMLGAALFPYVLLFLALLELARSFNLGNNLLALSFPMQPSPCLWRFCCLHRPSRIYQSILKKLPNWKDLDYGNDCVGS